MNAQVALGKSFVLVVLTILTVVGGCRLRERQKARDKVLDAINPRRITVGSNQSAVLRLPEGFAAIVFESLGQTSSFKVFFSELGRFTADQKPIAEDSFKQGNVSVAGAAIFIGYGGFTESSVMLDYGDTNTGIALSPTALLSVIDVSRLSFSTNRSLNSDDLMKSIGFSPR